MQNLFEAQQNYFQSGQTKDIRHRIEALKKLNRILTQYEKEILLALHLDLKKSDFEAYLAEYASIKAEIKNYLNKIHSWAKRKWVFPSLLTFPGQGYIYQEPYGCVVNISAWNYPFLETLIPLIGAIGAGNTCVLKPSEISSHSSNLLKKMINENFEMGHIHVVEGDGETVSSLLDHPWNYIFFTGSTKIGTIIYKKAAEYLTPVTLELGGKSPCIITPSANLEVAAKRIVWGKFSNAGQTCVAPDYLVIHETIKDKFILLLKNTLKDFYGENPKESKDYGRLISHNHWDRLYQLAQLSQKNILSQNFDKDQLYIAPLIFENCDTNSALMQEEIFGPLLPCLTYTDENSLDLILKKNLNPLSFYLFCQDTQFCNALISKYAFGGGCINDVMMHLVNNNLPFGGVGKSGMGNYHGKKTFETFSHQKSILKQSSWLDFSFKYPPYSTFKTQLLKFFTK